MKHPSVKNHNQVGHLKAVLARRGGGGILNEPISCCLIKASESKYSIDSFILSFTEGSFVVNDLCRNLTIPHICFTLRNIFAKRDAQRNRTNAARWKRCFLIDMNDLKWRLLGGGMGPIRNRKTVEKIIQNRNTDKKFDENRKLHAKLSNRYVSHPSY